MSGFVSMFWAQLQGLLYLGLTNEALLAFVTFLISDHTLNDV